MKETEQYRSSQEESLARRHEVSDVHFGRILLTGFGLLGLMILGLVYSDVVEGIFSGASPDPGAPTQVLISPDLSRMPPGPRVEPDPHANLLALRAHEDSVLERYHWVSRDSGIVRVPVERAMELALKEGILKSR